MLFFTWLSGGGAALFMDFRKVWEPREIQSLARRLKGFDSPAGICGPATALSMATTAAPPVSTGPPGRANRAGRVHEERLDAAGLIPSYFPGGGNSVTFVSPGGINGIAGRLVLRGSNAHGRPSVGFGPAHGLLLGTGDDGGPANEASRAVCQAPPPAGRTPSFVPKYATIAEYKQYAPANHLHMTWKLPPARLEHWMDLTGVRSVTPWIARPAWIEGVDRPMPLLKLLDG